MMPVLAVRGPGLPDLQVHCSADVYPLSQTAVLASGLTCQPRPVFQSFSAYTPKLAEMSAAHLRSERVPDHILFDVWSIDDRFAARDDSLSSPDLEDRCAGLPAAACFAHSFTRSGRTYAGRLLPAEARAGFLLSPVVDNRDPSSHWHHEPADVEVTSARSPLTTEKE